MQITNDSIRLSTTNLTSAEIVCSNHYFFENYAKCQLKDDISPKLQIIFMLLFCVTLALLGKNIINLILINKLEKLKKIKHMRTFNLWLIPTVALQLLLYANSFLENLGFGGYPLALYQILASTQVLALNTLMALGGYLWMVMIFKMSFNNKKRFFVEVFFTFCCLINAGFCLYSTIIPLASGLRDTTWWPDFLTRAQIIMIFVTTSTFINGLFFSIGSFYASKYMTDYQNFQVSNKKLVCDLTLLAGIFSLVRIIQDFVQSFWPVVATLKEDSVTNDDWGYPIYLLIYLSFTNIVPIIIFLHRYSPSIQEEKKLGGSSAGLLEEEYIAKKPVNAIDD